MKVPRLTYVIVAALVVVIAAALWLLMSAPVPPLVPVESAAVAEASAPVDFPPGVAVAMPMPEPPADLPPPKQRPVVSPEALREMNDVQFMLRDYRTRMGGNPGGTNGEIMKAVMGQNPVQARLGPPEGQQLNQDGELLDRWGVPYFFHQLSMVEMEVRSAGPDRSMYTSDDIVVN